jgi:predicted DNA-binding transcriptional regulator AlpA
MAASRTKSPQKPPHVLPQGRLLRVREAAPLMGYAAQSIYNSLWSGEGPLAKIPIYRVGRSIRICESDIAIFLAARRVEPPAGR